MRLIPARRKVPLLLTLGGKDRTVTPGSVRRVYAKQKTSSATHRPESISRQIAFSLRYAPGWEEVADAALDWLDNP